MWYMNCIQCDKVTNRKKFCSTDCGAKFHREKRLVSLGWIKHKPKIDYSCKWCQKKLSGQRRKFCCQSHAMDWQAKFKPEQLKAASRKYHKKNWKKIRKGRQNRKWTALGVKNFAEFQKIELSKEKICQTCKNPFHSEWAEKKYCSAGCRPVRISESKFNPTKICKECGCDFQITLNKTAPTKYCHSCRIIVFKRLRRERNQRIKFPSNAWFKRKFRSTIRMAIKRQSKHHKKLQITAILLGCTFDELKSHLQSKFKDGMTWENYGYYGWHIDHIRPCASFDLANPEHQKQCFHYTNLQPLWWHENIAKSDKRIIPPRNH